MSAQETTVDRPTLHLARWTVTSGSNVQSRGAVVIEAGDHHWRASAEGNGAVDALFKAVDAALADVLDGHPRLVGYDVHALAENSEAEGLVIVAVQPPAGAEGERANGLYNGRARSTNIIAASIEAYVEALNAMLAEEHWAGAAESAGKGRRGPAEHHGRRGELDKDADDSLPWVG
jgi:2-isopropylmalate synthase